MILLYHKVADVVPTKWWVSADRFYRQMASLRDRKVVYLDDYDRTDEKHVCITFDGIYENVYTFAAPILEHFGYPYELFIVGGTVGRSNEFDAEEPLARFADKAQLSDMVRRGARLQWHTRTHPRLTDNLTRTKLKRELDVPATLRRIDPGGFRWLGYPHGEFSKATLDVVKNLFVGALSCHQGDGVSSYELNRTIVTEESRLITRKIGVIIPCYNYGNFLAEAAASVLRQTVLPDRVLVVDDASSDGTEVIGRALETSHPNLVTFVRHKKNLGIVRTFNEAVTNMDTDYVVFLGADNRFMSNYIEKSAETLDADSAVGVAYTDYALFGPRAPVVYRQFPEAMRGETRADTFWIINFPDEQEHVVKVMTTGKENVIHGSSMFRREAWATVGGYREFQQQPEDFDLFRRIVGAGWMPKKVQGTYLEYRHHSPEQANARLQSAASVRALREALSTAHRVAESYKKQIDEFRRDAEERLTHVSLLQRENAEKTQQVLHFQKDAEERAKHVVILQEENETKTQQVLHFQKDTEERGRHIAILQKENETKTQQVFHFQRVAEERLRHIDILQREIEQRGKQVVDLQQELEKRDERAVLLEERIHTLGEEVEKHAAAASEASWRQLVAEKELNDWQTAEDDLLETAAELRVKLDATASQRDTLRTMMVAVQQDLDNAVRQSEARASLIQEREVELAALREELREASRQLRHHRKRLDRFTGTISGKLILPFGKSQRKLRNSIADARRSS